MQPYLTFDGNAAEALAFYASCLGGDIIASHTFGQIPAGEQPLPPGSDQRLMHGHLVADGLHLMASDILPGMPFDGHKGFSLSVQRQSVAEGEQVFQALGAGGTVTMPFAPTFWAKGFGMLTDKFGVPWMVNVEH